MSDDFDANTIQHILGDSLATFPCENHSVIFILRSRNLSLASTTVGWDRSWWDAYCILLKYRMGRKAYVSSFQCLNENALVIHLHVVNKWAAGGHMPDGTFPNSYSRPNFWELSHPTLGNRIRNETNCIDGQSRPRPCMVASFHERFSIPPTPPSMLAIAVDTHANNSQYPIQYKAKTRTELWVFLLLHSLL